MSAFVIFVQTVVLSLAGVDEHDAIRRIRGVSDDERATALPHVQARVRLWEIGITLRGHGQVRMVSTKASETNHHIGLYDRSRIRISYRYTVSLSTCSYPVMSPIPAKRDR